jgi:hypothetical protein
VVRVEVEPDKRTDDARSELAQPDTSGDSAGCERRRRAEYAASTPLRAVHVDVEPTDQALEVAERGGSPVDQAGDDRPC